MIASVLAGLVAIVLAGLGWKHRSVSGGGGAGADAFVVAAVSATTWCWSIAAFDLLDAPGRYPYAVVGVWLASVSTFAAAVFVMARRTVRARWSPPRALVALFVLEPLTIFALEATNPLHGLVGSKPDGRLVFGVAYQAHAAYCVSLVLASALALAVRASVANRAQRRQVLILQALIVAVVVVEISQLGLSHLIAVAGLAVLLHARTRQGLGDASAGVDDLMRRRTDRPVHHDPVTGLLTRAQLDHVVRRAVDRAAAAAAGGAVPLSVALMDVDSFKGINDTYGHLAGDEVLAEIARRVGQAAGESVEVGRFGGDEFVAVLVGHGLDDAVRVAEAMREAVAAAPMTAGDVVVRVTVTIGVAEYRGGPVRDLLRTADDSMYTAKRAGRNRVGAGLSAP